MTAEPVGLGRRIGVLALKRPWAWVRRRWDVLLLLGPALAYLILFSVFPLVYSLAISFFRYEVQQSRFVFVGIDNYVNIMQDAIFWEALGNTAFMTFAGVGIQVVLGVGLAIFFALELRGSTTVRTILIVPMILNPIVVGLMWRALLNPQWGVVNWFLLQLSITPPNWLGDPDVAIWVLTAADIWQWTPFIFIIVFARLQALPQDVYEAAEVDGAGPAGMLRYITLPLLAPAIAFAAVFRAIDAFRSFDIVYGLTYGGPGRSTTTLSFFSFETGFSFTRYGYASAIAYVMVIAAAVGLTLLLRMIQLRREDAT